MKKVFLLCVVSFAMFVATAQSKKGKVKSKVSNKELIAKAKFNKAESTKKLMRDSLITGMRLQDSLRLAGENLADIQKDSMSLAYKNNGLKRIDSFKNIRYAIIVKNRNDADKIDKVQSEINRVAKLNQYQSKQVMYINQTYTEKAKAIIQGNDAQTKKVELVALNEERKNKIRTIVGKSRVKKLENVRRDFEKKNGADENTAWINIAESVALK